MKSFDQNARLNADLRAVLVQEFGALSADQVHEQSGTEVSERLTLEERWRLEGRIIGVDHDARICYPGFQFDRGGQPLAVIAQVIAVFGIESDCWQSALWFILTNGWLGGKRPVDLLLSDPEAVIFAAQQEAPEIF